MVMVMGHYYSLLKLPKLSLLNSRGEDHLFQRPIFLKFFMSIVPLESMKSVKYFLSMAAFARAMPAQSFEKTRFLILKVA